VPEPRGEFGSSARRAGTPALGQKCPKRLRLLAGKSTYERIGRIVPQAEISGLAVPLNLPT
jgi:hypothetical protein